MSCANFAGGCNLIKPFAASHAFDKDGASKYGDPLAGNREGAQHEFLSQPKRRIGDNPIHGIYGERLCQEIGDLGIFVIVDVKACDLPEILSQHLDHMPGPAGRL